MESTYGVFIIRPDHKVLLCHPTGHKPNYFSIPKGLPDEGETPMETAVREVLEETGIILTKETLCPLPPIKYKGRPKTLCPFYCFIDVDELKRIDRCGFSCSSFFDLNGADVPEVDGWVWVDMDDPSIEFQPTQKISYTEWINSISL